MIFTLLSLYFAFFVLFVLLFRVAFFRQELAVRFETRNIIRSSEAGAFQS